MSLNDIIEMAQKNFKRLLKNNIGLIIIFAIVIVVFNITYAMTSEVVKNTTSNITENQNLKIINVSTVTEEIAKEDKEYISKISNVEMTVYDYCLSIAIEDGRGNGLAAIGMDDEQASYLVGESICLGDNGIVLNSSFKEMGYKVGENITISYNVRVSETSGIRQEKTYSIVAFYQQPVIETWYDSVAILSQNNIYDMASNLYGVKIEDFENSSLYKQSLLVFVNEVDNVAAVAEAIEDKGMITSYALAYSQELPTFARTIISIGGAIIVILIIMGIIVMNATVNKNVENRYKEIGILKSIGMGEKHIFMILSTEILLLWMVISIFAIIVTILIAQIIPGLLGLFAIERISISALQILLSIGITYLIMFLTTMLAIMKASKLKIIEVLRNE